MIKYQLERIKDMYSGISDPDILDGIPVVTVAQSDIEWLIEQAERVQELEGTVKHAMKAIDNTEAVRVKLINAEQQNKRYREAIEVAIHNIAASENLGVKFALKILEQALEGSEWVKND